jgi:phosphoglycerol transferase MdoB-like AlkP superfamily enzyme
VGQFIDGRTPLRYNRRILILSLIEIVLVAVAGVFTWQLNRRVSRIQNRTVRVAVRILVNVVAAIVILLLLSFLVFRQG